MDGCAKVAVVWSRRGDVAELGDLSGATAARSGECGGELSQGVWRALRGIPRQFGGTSMLGTLRPRQSGRCASDCRCGARLKTGSSTLHFLKTRAGAAVLVLTLVAVGTVGQGTVASVASASAASYSAVCWKPNPKVAGSTTTSWNGKNPKDCNARYQLYDTSRGRGALVIDINKTANTTAFWSAVSRGYSAAQTWCNKNSLSCSILVSVGVALLQPLTSAARG